MDHRKEQSIAAAPNLRRQIWRWDWRYHVGYDLTVREEVWSVIEAMPSAPEKARLIDIFLWSVSFVSVDALLDRCLAREIDLESPSIQAEPTRLLHVPAALVSHLEAKARALPASEADVAHRLIAQAKVVVYDPKHVDLFQHVFGDELTEMSPLPPPSLQ